MKQLLSILLLSVITVTAYADKNSKPNKVQQVQAKAEQLAKPASDTTAHYDYGTRTYDPRLGRSMYVAPKQQQNKPYQNTTNKPVKLDK